MNIELSIPVALSEATLAKTNSTPQQYISARVEKLPFSNEWGWKNEIKLSIFRKAGEMFLWAKLALDMLMMPKNRRTAGDIRRHLHQLPGSIKNSIGHTLDSYYRVFPDYECHEMIQILNWLSHSFRPVTLVEIGAMLRWPTADANPVIGLEERLREEYSSLLKAIREVGLTTSILLEKSRNYGSMPGSQLWHFHTLLSNSTSIQTKVVKALSLLEVCIVLSQWEVTSKVT